MPDLLSHALLGHAIHRLRPAAAATRPGAYTLVMAGSLLPDLVSWLPMNFYLKLEAALDLPSEPERYFPPMHSPMLVVLWCLLLALLFVPPLRRPALAALLLGAAGHVGLDLLQLKYDGGYLVFYPLDLRRHQIGLVPQDSWRIWIAVNGAACLLIEGARRWAARRACS